VLPRPSAVTVPSSMRRSYRARSGSGPPSGCRSLDRGRCLEHAVGYLVVVLGVAEAGLAGGEAMAGGQSVHLRRSRSFSAAPLLLTAARQTIGQGARPFERDLLRRIIVAGAPVRTVPRGVL